MPVGPVEPVKQARWGPLEPVGPVEPEPRKGLFTLFSLAIAVQNLCALLLSNLFWPLHAITNHNSYSELLKLNDFNEMSVPAARTQLLKLTNVASSLCLAS